MYINSAGLTSHMDQIINAAKDIKPICICISETHVTEDIYDKEISIPGYVMEQTT
jgi:hypothetical protein